MAGSDPWINWSWLKIGPFTPTEEDRVAAERRRAELDAKENLGGIGSLRGGDPTAAKRVDMSRDNPLQNAVDNASGVANAIGAAQTAADQPAKFPETFDDWTMWDRLRAPFVTGGEDAYRKARGLPVDETTPMDTIIPAEQGDGSPESDITRRAREGNVGAVMPTIPEQPTDLAPVEVPAVDPQTQMIEDLKRQKALIDQIYPQRPVDNTSYQEADAYAASERDRAKNLAQLAFFGAITQGAGGRWEGVGRGLLGAGQVYSKGFERYQDALTTKAKRMVAQREQSYDDQTARTEGALKLYSAEQDRKKGQMSEARLALKERMDNIDTYFKERLKLAKGDEFAPTDQSVADRLMKEWQLSRDRGEITSLTDVKDKEKK